MEKTEIIKSIEQLMNDQMIEEAYSLIKEYKSSIGADDGILSVEAVYHICQEDYDKAMQVVKEGLKYNIFSSDLYNTMGNIYEIEGNLNKAYLCYEQALYLCENADNKLIIEEYISNLSGEVNVNKVSIVILTYNQLDYTKVCLNSIRKYNSKGSYEIIIVDNNSTDGTVEWLKEQSDIKLILNDKNKGFPAGCNQGIEIAEKDNDIFLLNNDTVIMPNSILNLRMALYSDENVGATGAVSNSVSYYQQIGEHFEDFDEYLKYASKNNIVNEKRYERRSKLVGFAMLIRRKVLDKIGILDERFTPGNFEDDDLSFRIIKSNYKLILCRDSYIHHFGSVSFRQDANKYNELLQTNRNKFNNKWKFDVLENLNIYSFCIEYIKKQSENILEICCGSGSNLLNLKDKYKDKSFYGYEENEALREIIENNGITLVEDFTSGNYKEFFDTVIISNLKQLIEEPNLLNKVYDNLKADGNLIIIADGFRLENKLDEKFINSIIDISKRHNFKAVDAKYLDANDNLMLQAYLIFDKVKMLDKKIIRIHNNIKFLIRRIDFNKDFKDNTLLVEEIKRNKISSDFINEIIDKDVINKVAVLNEIAVTFFENEEYENIIPFLQKAYEINQTDFDTLYNLSYVLNFLGEKELALEYAEKIIDKSNEVLELIEIIKAK